MASSSSLPIPLPPQTPSPPPDNPDQRSLAPEPQYDPNALSPMHGIMQNERLKEDIANMGPTSPTSPSFGSFSSHGSNANAGSDPNPFNFQPMALAKSPVMKSNIGQRRGHKYKHSMDVLGNFEVWKRSSVRHPFGLERAEVLAGFAASVLLVFMGMDLISHNLQHWLEASPGHQPHHSHEHDRVSAGSVDLTAVLAIGSTLVSAIGLKNHARIGKSMRFAYIESLPSVLSNPSHFLTLSCSTLLLILPLLSVSLYNWLDKLLSLSMAISMCVLGSRIVKALGSILLMSFSGNGVSDVMRDIQADPAVTAIDDARFWQVHYGLCMANLKLRVTGTEETLVKLREKITSLIRNRLGGGYGSGGQKWEVTLQFTAERL
ncbi:Cation efflux protein [Penicillium occitanis (nom. inval.)]|nr:Cation efflux protein [Penicillium occitanis (nom. inval.)]PCG94617.1 hypothetical protein PENOC_081840 [Penicillium occitanis (nom. inval.)]